MTDLERLFREVLGRGLSSAELLMRRLSRHLDVRLAHTDDFARLTDEQQKRGIAYLSQDAYASTLDIDRAARIATKKAS